MVSAWKVSKEVVEKTRESALRSFKMSSQFALMQYRKKMYHHKKKEARRGR